MRANFLKTLATALLLAAMPVAVAEMDARLIQVIGDRSEEARARDAYRHPAQTLDLFGIQPGMTVIDALPGDWYGDILAPLLGPDGRYIGVSYGEWFFKNRFGEGYEERWQAAQSFLTEWPETARAYGDGTNPPATDAYFFPGLPASLDGTVDAVLFFRALHHTNRYDPAVLDQTAADAFRVLKTGGVVGVVQHRAPEDADPAWANGDNGYLKQSRVVEAFTSAGFTLEEASEINANPKDKPTSEDKVWRLPPSSDAPEALAIGESDRMTLLFRKP